MTLPPIIYAAAIGRAASGRWWWSCRHPACTEYRSGYPTKDGAQVTAYRHHWKEHR